MISFRDVAESEESRSALYRMRHVARQLGVDPPPSLRAMLAPYALASEAPLRVLFQIPHC